MPFEFVDNNAAAIDRATRKRIRSHVAIGRNAGKKLVRKSRKDIDASIPRIEWPVGDDVSLFPFPEQVTPESKGLVRRGMYYLSLLKLASPT